MISSPLNPMSKHLTEHMQMIARTEDVDAFTNLLRFYCGLSFSPGRIVQEFENAGVSRKEYARLRAQIPIQEIVPIEISQNCS
ncbi:MAG TPA: hypothetical protein DD473_01320 [Planctomycetaceae bacterium]|nr:hypothetical protein [Planctomycetaceae bacterium]